MYSFIHVRQQGKFEVFSNNDDTATAAAVALSSSFVTTAVKFCVLISFLRPTLFLTVAAPPPSVLENWRNICSSLNDPELWGVKPTAKQALTNKGTTKKGAGRRPTQCPYESNSKLKNCSNKEKDEVCLLYKKDKLLSQNGLQIKRGYQFRIKESVYEHFIENKLM
uniref:Uncharacterized protein n=1 Tax=Romanomermis culicivorax TaxID=13658 RepID=A0A915K2H9_ROMCU